MKLPNKTVITLISIPIVILLFFSSNIYGYFRFKSYCSSEGGLRVYEPLEKNVGWWAEERYEAKVASQLAYVGFVRYADAKNGLAYDVRYKGGNPTKDSSYGITPADESKPLSYKWKNVSEGVDNEIRLRRFGKEILDITNNNILSQYYMFSYRTFNKTSFDMPSINFCFDDPAGREGEVSGWLKALNTAFKN